MSMDELNKMAVQIKILEEQIEGLQGQIQLIENSILNLENSNFTVENMKTVEEGQEILIPIGGVAYIKAIVTDTKKLIINLGSDYFADVTIDIAKESIDKRINDLKESQQFVMGRLQQYANQMNEIRPKFQELYNKLQQQQLGAPPSS